MGNYAIFPLLIILIVVTMLKSGRNILILIVLLSGLVPAYGQQDPVFSQYMHNQLFYNPAFAGVEGNTKMTFLHRSQWLGYTPTFDDGGAPTTQVLNLTTPILKFRSGAGINVVNDNLGPVNNLHVMGSYAYHLAVFDGKLSFGLRAGVISQSIDFNKYRPVQTGDPILLTGKETQFRPDLGFGIYYKAEKYWGGLSMNHLLETEFDFGISSDSLRNALAQNLVFMGGYVYELNYDVVLRPSVLVQSDFNTYSFDISLIGVYRERLQGGVSYRQGEAAVALLGYSLLKEKSLYVGYSFDYVLHAQEAKQKTSHEFLLSYTLPALTGGGKKVIRTPRFRH
jgi:type IX secretion system PorP/SprF family membrane protein